MVMNVQFHNPLTQLILEFLGACENLYCHKIFIVVMFLFIATIFMLTIFQKLNGYKNYQTNKAINFP